MKMKQGLPFVEGAPVGIDGTSAWIRNVGTALKVNPATVNAVAAEKLARERGTDVDRTVVEEITARYAPGR
jgi:nitrogenase molybdenum-iron protein alpha/beta subunit